MLVVVRVTTFSTRFRSPVMPALKSSATERFLLRLPLPHNSRFLSSSAALAVALGAPTIATTPRTKVTAIPLRRRASELTAVLCANSPTTNNAARQLLAMALARAPIGAISRHPFGLDDPMASCTVHENVQCAQKLPAVPTQFDASSVMSGVPVILQSMARQASPRPYLAVGAMSQAPVFIDSLGGGTMGDEAVVCQHPGNRRIVNSCGVS